MYKKNNTASIDERDREKGTEYEQKRLCVICEVEQNLGAV